MLDQEHYHVLVTLGAFFNIFGANILDFLTLQSPYRRCSAQLLNVFLVSAWLSVKLQAYLRWQKAVGLQIRVSFPDFLLQRPKFKNVILNEIDYFIMHCLRCFHGLSDYQYHSVEEFPCHEIAYHLEPIDHGLAVYTILGRVKGAIHVRSGIISEWLSYLYECRDLLVVSFGGDALW